MSGGASTVRAGAPQPDRGMIEVFADVVFGYVEGVVPVRILIEKGSAVSDATPWTETLGADARLGTRLRSLAGKAARAGRALYVVPATLREPGRATADNIGETAVVVVDLDAGDIPAKRAFLEKHLGAPSLVVASGGVTTDGARKLHLYWRLNEAARGDDLVTVRRLRLTIAEKAGGDPSLGRIHQPIRVAGSLHQKLKPPVLAEIVERNDAEYELMAFADAVAAMPATFAKKTPETFSCASSTVPGLDTLKRAPIREDGLDGVTRFDALSRVMGHWIRRARLGEVGFDDAYEAVRDHNATLIRPPWEEARLAREFEALRKRDAEKSAGRSQKMELAPLPNDIVTEDALAASFVARHGSDWRHVALARSWRRWDGCRWVADGPRSVIDVLRTLCRETAATLGARGDAKRLGSWKTLQAVERIASTDPAVAAMPDDFDADPNLLNTPGGVIDLRTGEITPCNPAALMTKIAGAAPDGAYPRWLRFIDEITDGDPEMAGYLQRMAGYCLTGSTEEQVFFFLHGHGANGKSILLDTIAAAMGDYAKTAPFETFAASNNPGHPTDLAGLVGARLVAVTETERNRTWAESRIKSITGGDAISARVMRGNFFEFRPTFKLMIAGNHLPRLSSFGEAMRRRLHLVPFRVTFPPDTRDLRLRERLRAELGGVLSWMIDGCAEWRRIGLAPPEAVTGAAQAYFEAEDVIGQWLSEHCDLGADHRATSASLYADWSRYADAGGYPSGTQRALATELETRGFESVRGAGGIRGWRGLALKRRGGSEA